MTWVQILDKAIWVSLCANALRNTMNLSILPPAMESNNQCCLDLFRQIILEKENFEFKPVLFKN